jgi:hypothetical protein
MPNFAVIEDGVVLNTILAESKTIAEEVTGKTCIEFTTESAEVGGTYTNKKFFKRKPYPSWVTDGKDGWVAPVAYPTIEPENPKAYRWDELETNWVEITA